MSVWYPNGEDSEKEKTTYSLRNRKPRSTRMPRVAVLFQRTELRRDLPSMGRHMAETHP